MDPVLPSHLLCVYAEPLAVDRRVLVVGDATQDLGARLLDMGARLVHVYDPDAERTRRASPARGVVLRHLAQELDVRDGAFDLVIVPDVAIFDDATALVARLRRVVDRDGAVLIAARNPQSWDAAQASSTRVVDYYELYDIVSLQFACVRMIGQVPFFGAAIAELGEADEEPEVSVHTELSGDPEPPEYFIALASHSDQVRLAPYAIVQLPRDSVSLSMATTQEGVEAADRAVLVEANARAHVLEGELEEQRRRIAELEAQAAQAAALAARIPELEQELFEATTRVQQLEVDIDRRREHAIALEDAVRVAEETAAALEARTRDAEQTALLRAEQRTSVLAELDALRAEADSLRADADTLRTDAETLRADSETLRASLETERRAAEQRALSDSEEVDRLLLQIGEHEEKANLVEQEFSQMAEAHALELGALEARLVERGHRIAELERELARREGIVLGLVAELEEATGVAPVLLADSEETAAAAISAAAREAEWVARLDAMAIDAARREGELHARTWRIAELEGELTRGQQRPPEAADRVESRPPQEAADLRGAQRLARLEDELDILRRALAQEHEARQRAESGEELSRARAELQRQAVLLEQLSRELPRM